MPEFETPANMRHGMPRKVMAKALQLGIHNDCIVAGPEGVCDDCRLHITMAFDFYYGDSTNTKELLETVARDFLDDFEAAVYSDGE